MSGSQLKESIVIGSYSDSLLGYQYILDTGGMVPILTDSGEIQLYDASGQEMVMVMPAPYLLDDAGVYCDDVTVDLSNIGGSYVLSYLLPQEWLAEDDRQWPVILDPIISREADFANAEDQNVYENPNITTSPSTGSVTCGYDSTCKAIRFYFKYTDLPDLTSADVVVNASLSLYATAKSGAATIEVHKVTEDWTAGDVTWADQPAFEDNVEDFARCTTIERFYSWEITDMVRSWYTGDNFGMVFKLSNAMEAARQTSWFRFYSSDMDIACMPVLSVVFRNNNGLESYWDYTATSAGRAGTGYINNYTGNLVWVHNDIGFGGNRMPVSISHIYNANDSANNTFGMGYGWRTNFNQRVYHWDNEEAALDYYVWEDSDGTYHYFYKDTGTAGIYHDEDGLELTLSTTGSGEKTYTITDKYGNCSYFDTEGRLRMQENNQEDKRNIAITYTTTNGYLISTITDGAGRVYSFTYNGSLLSRISYKGTGSSELTYVSFGYTNSNLESITDKDGKASEFEYTSNNLLSKVQDIDGYALSYTYNTLTAGLPNRVASVTETDGSASGGNLAITYAQNQTTFTDYSGNVQIHQFNNWGNTVSIQDDQGRAQHAQFAFTNTSDITAPTENNGYAKGNQLRVSSKLQNTVGNMLDDSSFERSVNWTATSSAVTASVASGTAYYGTKALKLVRSTAGTAAGAYSTSFSVGGNESVTFSAYVKTGTGAAYLALTDGSTTVTSQPLAANSEWTRLEVCYTNSSTSAKSVTARIMTAEAGTVYMDCAQVEKCVTASRYNLVENGDFRYTTAWSASVGRTTGTAAAPELSTDVYQLSGAALYTNRLSQTVYISGSAGDTFALTGWAKGDSVPLNTSYNLPREFGLIITFNHTDGTKASATVRFNPYVTNWQYTAGYAIASKAYSSIKVEIAYDHNMNSAIFDGIQLFKEEFGTSYTYDANGNVVSVTDLEKQKTRYEYTDNDLTKEILPTGLTLTYTYDDYHNVIKAESTTGIVYNFAYDTYGNNTSVSVSANGITLTTSAQYSNDKNRLESITDAAGSKTTYVYDQNTNVLLSVQDSNDITATVYDYDSLFRLESVQAASDQNTTLSATYGYLNDLLKTITTGSTTYTFDYGDFGLRSAIRAGSRTLATYGYMDRTNYLSSLDYGNGDKVKYTYDTQGRLTQESYYENNSTTVDSTTTYQYDNNGALASVADSASGISTKYFYDLINRPVSTVRKLDSTTILTTLLEYDEKNRVEASNWSFPHMTSTLQNANRYSNVYTYNEAAGTVNDMTLYFEDRAVLSSSYSYDALNRLTKVDLISGKADREYTYRTDKNTNQVQLLNYNLLYGGFPFVYYYDSVGNIMTYHAPGESPIQYTYDSQNQLIRAVSNDNTYSYSYTYDDAGNILTANGHTYTYDDTNGWGDLLTKYDNHSISYDAIGNPTSYYNGTSWAFTWKHGRQLARAEGNGKTVNYTYDADGMRTSKTVNGVVYNYYYVGSQLARMTYGSNIIDFYYDANGVPIVMNQNGNLYYYITNLQGDVIRLVDVYGNIAAMYQYDPYGNTISSAGSHVDINPLRYRGYVYDSDTGLYYCQSRYYDPVIGRFISADSYTSTGQGIIGNNMFAYCNNNPVSFVDYSGCSPLSLFDTIDEAAIDFAQYINEKSIDENLEYASFVYRKTRIVMQNRRITLPKWAQTISGKSTINVIIPCLKHSFYYVEPNAGTIDNSKLSVFGLVGAKAILHTHGAYMSNYASDIFSPGDKEAANRLNLTIYVSTPSGTLRRYDPKTATDTIISVDIPYDPRHPDRSRG